VACAAFSGAPPQTSARFFDRLVAVHSATSVEATPSRSGRRGIVIEHNLAKARQSLVSARPNLANPVGRFVKWSGHLCIADLSTSPLAAHQAARDVRCDRQSSDRQLVPQQGCGCGTTFSNQPLHPTTGWIRRARRRPHSQPQPSRTDARRSHVFGKRAEPGRGVGPALCQRSPDACWRRRRDELMFH
jgi:hypothetical protein